MSDALDASDCICIRDPLLRAHTSGARRAPRTDVIARRSVAPRRRARCLRTGQSARVASWSERRRAKAVERQDRGYPAPLRALAPTVDDQHWVSQFEAAKRLRVSLLRVGALIQSGQLQPVHNVRGQAGVSPESVDRQAKRRSGAGPLRRFWFAASDLAKILV